MSEIVRGISSSAGGKVMVTGGYLVLERPNKGLVLSVDAKIHSSVCGLTDTCGYAPSSPIPSDSFPIYLSTPQLSTEGIELYATVDASISGDAKIVLGGSVSRNKFVSTTIQHCLTIIASIVTQKYWDEHTSKGLGIYIYGDLPFYTSASSLPGSMVSTSGIDPESGHPVRLTHKFNPDDFKTKTGLGSSAALVSSLTSALFAYFGLFIPMKYPSTLSDDSDFVVVEENQDEDDEELVRELRAVSAWGVQSYVGNLTIRSAFRMVYQTAQFAHCAAQGKVGSGFDVAACFYGNQTYCRFSPSVIAPLLEYAVDAPPSGAALLGLLGPNAIAAWDDESEQFSLPEGIQLLLGDVHGGSETPGMVKTLMKWRDTAEEGHTVWASVASANRAVEACFRVLSRAAQHDISAYQQTIAQFALLPPSQWTLDFFSKSNISHEDSNKEVDNDCENESGSLRVVRALIDLRDSMAAARVALREMGNLAGVPVEPETQTVVLDSAMEVPGVIAAGVPGAGGYDALFVLYIEGSVAPTSLREQWRQTNNTTRVSPLNVAISRRSTVSATLESRIFDFTKSKTASEFVSDMRSEVNTEENTAEQDTTTAVEIEITTKTESEEKDTSLPLCTRTSVREEHDTVVATVESSNNVVEVNEGEQDDDDDSMSFWDTAMLAAAIGAVSVAALAMLRLSLKKN